LYIFTHSTNPELSFSRKISTPASLFLSLNIGLYAIVPPPPPSKTISWRIGGCDWPWVFCGHY
jgi:hypothetical protein